MRLYDIRVYNGGGVEIESVLIHADNENAAIKRLLDDVTICDGDTIKIEEVGNYEQSR